MAAAGAPPQSTERRDKLQEMELEVQKKWEAMKIFEVDAGEEGEEKFFVTFPYPYMNGILHLGHAYSLTKAIFAAQFHRLLGKKVLFPFGFHCTGMPIQAAANKLAREYQVYATKDPVYPIFPPGRPQTLEKAELHGDQVDLIFKAPSSTGNLALKEFVVLLKKGEDLEEVGKVAAPSPEQLKAAGNKVTCRVRYVPQGVYKARAVLADGTVSPEGKESDPVSLEEAQDAKGKGKGKGKDSERGPARPRVQFIEKPNLEAAKYFVDRLPFPFTSPAQYEQGMQMPTGPEWNAMPAHMNKIKPKMFVKIGAIVPPLQHVRHLPEEHRQSVLDTWARAKQPKRLKAKI